jgi:hypothetical protein
MPRCAYRKASGWQCPDRAEPRSFYCPVHGRKEPLGNPGCGVAAAILITFAVMFLLLVVVAVCRC